MDSISRFLDNNRALGLTLLRVATGLLLFQAGYVKIFVKGFGGLGQQFAQMGFVIPEVVGPFIGLLELIGGAALVLGIWTRYLGVVFTIEFIVAAYWVAVHFHRGLPGARLEILIAAAALALATNGAGAFNLGNLLKKGN